MFSVEAQFDEKYLENYIKQETDAWFKRLSDDYIKAMHTFVERVRSQAGFGNVSWNLRSSIGGIVVINTGSPQVVDVYFPTLNGAPEGAKVGEDYAREIATYSQEEGVQAIIVVGMEYASLVEATRGDIITVASAGFPKDLLAEFNK